MVSVDPAAVGPGILSLAAIAADTTGLPPLRFVSEREAGSWICCGPCAAVMVAGWHDPGSPATLAAAHELRKAIPDDHAGGLSVAQLATGSEAWTGGDWRAYRAVDVLGLLGRGHAVVLGLDYGELPAELRRWSPSFDGGHYGTLAGRKAGPFGELVGWWDPLAPAGWSGEWVRWSILMDAAWSGGSVLTTLEPREAATMLVSDPTPRRVDYPADTPLYGTDGLTLVTRLSKAATLYSPYAVAADYAVVVTTSGVTQVLRARKSAATSAVDYGGGSDAEWRAWLAGAPTPVAQPIADAGVVSAWLDRAPDKS